MADEGPAPAPAAAAVVGRPRRRGVHHHTRLPRRGHHPHRRPGLRLHAHRRAPRLLPFVPVPAHRLDRRRRRRPRRGRRRRHLLRPRHRRRLRRLRHGRHLPHGATLLLPLPPCLRAYLGLSVIWVLLLLGGQKCLLLLSCIRLPLDVVSCALLLPNAAAALAVAAISPASVPIALHQAALVAIAVLTAFWFTLLPEWTTWALLVAMAVYDLGAVLIPGGPLRVLLELAIERNEEIPALVYGARPVDPRHGHNWRLWRERARQLGGDLDPSSTVEVLGRNPLSNSGGNSPNSMTQAGEQTNLTGAVSNSRLRESPVPDLSSGSANAQVREALALPETRLDIAELRVPLIQPQPDRSSDDDDEDGIGLASSGAIKLGLGDFIFYSVLVGRAAMYDYMTVYACYLAIIAGLGITLLLLAFYHKALPALPVSITLGVLFYVLTRTLLEAFVMQCTF